MKRDKVGDLLLATPMLRALRAALPHAVIHLLATGYNAWVVEGNPDLDAVHAYDRARTGRRAAWRAALGQAATWWRLRRARFDVAIAANGEDSPRATRRALLAGARRTIAYASPPARGLTDALAPPADGHEVERMLGLLAPLGIEPPREPSLPAWRPGEVARVAARRWLAERALAPGGYVVIGLGARRAKKQPQAAQVLRWSEALRSRHGLQTVFMWTPGASGDPLYPGDDAAAAPVLSARVPWIHPFRGPLQPAAALAWDAATSLFPDSGLMHLAAASAGGVVGLFAETAVSPPPSRWAPRGANVAWLEARSAVSELEDERVLEALQARLSRRAAPG